jgi:hypothetical protein
MNCKKLIDHLLSFCLNLVRLEELGIMGLPNLTSRNT